MIVEKVKNLKGANGLNAATGEYEDLVKAGVIDAAKVTRSALQNAASIAALFLTTEAVVADKPEEKAPPAACPVACPAWRHGRTSSPEPPNVEVRGAPFGAPHAIPAAVGRVAAHRSTRPAEAPITSGRPPRALHRAYGGRIPGRRAR